MLTEVTAIRYVTPLREGGSLPGLVEADDLGTYVVKFTGAGQGPTALVAEVVAGELARRLGLRVPDLVVVELDPVIGLAEPDEEVQHLLRSSGGPNLGMDYLPGSLGFDPIGFSIPRAEAGRILWFDALVGNVDRSWRNPNLLVWHGDVWLIDHGATLTFAHHWPAAEGWVARPYAPPDHVLAGYAPEVAAADAALAPLVTEELLREVVALVPDAWLVSRPDAAPEEIRADYVRLLRARVDAPRGWLAGLGGGPDGGPGGGGAR